MDYEEDDKNWLPIIAIIFLVLALTGGGIWYLLFGAQESSATAGTTPGTISSETTPVTNPTFGDAGETLSGESTEAVVETLDVKVSATRPEDTAAQLGKIFEAGDLDRASRALGGAEAGVSPEALRRLQALTAENNFRIKQVREVGELEINRRKRFAIEFEGSDQPLFLDLARGEDQKWSVEQVRLPKEIARAVTEAGTEQSNGAMTTLPEPGTVGLPERTSPAAPGLGDDSLTISDNFLQAALSQNFSKAKSFVDNGTVSDTKIAAMCILFEEGKYRLNPDKPLRAMFNRDTTAGFLANVLTTDAAQPAQFGVNLTRPTANAEWKVSEINLDSLLADYATRVAGGDVYYTPLVANPQGGETLVIFFGFDEETLAPRTQRQLGIVSDVLKTNPNRKLTLFGHADALGSDEYNKSLSQKRAASVRDFLIQNGVGSSQIDLVAEGETHPRRPNETAAGEDDPDGRRANRRTEIYLDFGDR